jgi:hypothetical protein
VKVTSKGIVQSTNPKSAWASRASCAERMARRTRISAALILSTLRRAMAISAGAAGASSGYRKTPDSSKASLSALDLFALFFRAFSAMIVPREPAKNRIPRLRAASTSCSIAMRRPF